LQGLTAHISVFTRKHKWYYLCLKLTGAAQGFPFGFTQTCQFFPNRKASPTQHRTKPGLTTLCKTERIWSTDNTWGLYHTWSSCSAERIKH